MHSSLYDILMYTYIHLFNFSLFTWIFSFVLSPMYHPHIHASILIYTHTHIHLFLPIYPLTHLMLNPVCPIIHACTNSPIQAQIHPPVHSSNYHIHSIIISSLNGSQFSCFYSSWNMFWAICHFLIWLQIDKLLSIFIVLNTFHSET